MLKLIPRTAVWKEASNLLLQHHHRIEDHHWFAWLFFFPSQGVGLTPNNTIEYANYLHIKSTPEKQNPWHRHCTRVQGRAWRGPNPILPTQFSSTEGSRGSGIQWRWYWNDLSNIHANQVLCVEVENLDMAVSGSWSQREREPGRAVGRKGCWPADLPL